MFVALSGIQSVMERRSNDSNAEGGHVVPRSSGRLSTRGTFMILLGRRNPFSWKSSES